LGINKEFNYLAEVKKRLTKTLYQEFLNCVNLFSQETITKLEVLQLAKWMFKSNRDLYDKFKLFIAFDEEDPFPPDVKPDPIEESLPESKIEPEQTLPMVTQEEEKDVEKEAEDEGVEMDLVAEMNASTMRAFEELTLTSDPIAAKAVVANLDVIHLRNVERMYGDKGSEVIEALHTNPLAVIPVVLKRLRQRNQEWSKQVPQTQPPLLQQPILLEEEEKLENNNKI